MKKILCSESPSEEQLLKTAQHGNNVEGIKCLALLDTGAGSLYASAALLDKLPKREIKRETRKVEMMLGTTTRKIVLQTINIKGISGQFSMSVEVAKVVKGELVSLDNPIYPELIRNNPHLKGVVMEDTDTK